MSPVFRFIVSGVGLICSAPALFGDVVADISVSLTSFHISAGPYTVQFFGNVAAAYVTGDDEFGGPCVATGPVTDVSNVCTGNVMGTQTASIGLTKGATTSDADANSSSVALDVSDGVHIPGVASGMHSASSMSIAAVDLPFEIVDTSNPDEMPVTATFSATLQGKSSLSVDNGQSSANSDLIFDVVLDGQSILTTGPSYALSGGPGNMVNPINTTLQTNEFLFTNLRYGSLELQLQADAGGVAAPEPSFFSVIGLALLALLVYVKRRCAP
jgi:hypothetical protein